ncbi:hypothetical protein KY334_06265 [Candidatus Woesearchaeota archaeon]|nr:hypothetical protein [Candidatus Woesearchaeota archaeon]
MKELNYPFLYIQDHVRRADDICVLQTSQTIIADECEIWNLNRDKHFEICVYNFLDACLRRYRGKANFKFYELPITIVSGNEETYRINNLGDLENLMSDGLSCIKFMHPYFNFHDVVIFINKQKSLFRIYNINPTSLSISMCEDLPNSLKDFKIKFQGLTFDDIFNGIHIRYEGFKNLFKKIKLYNKLESMVA